MKYLNPFCDVKPILPNLLNKVTIEIQLTKCQNLFCVHKVQNEQWNGMKVGRDKAVAK